MKVIKFPEAAKPEYLTAPQWLRKVADKIEEDYGSDVFLDIGVLTFNDTEGGGYFYSTPGEHDCTLEEIGIMELAKNYLINSTREEV